jgi:hypothetical protein
VRKQRPKWLLGLSVRPCQVAAHTRARVGILQALPPFRSSGHDYENSRGITRTRAWAKSEKFTASSSPAHAFPPGALAPDIFQQGLGALIFSVPRLEMLESLGNAKGTSSERGRVNAGEQAKLGTGNALRLLKRRNCSQSSWRPALALGKNLYPVVSRARTALVRAVLSNSETRLPRIAIKPNAR